MVSDKQRISRKLAAILYADVAGYSRLTGDDEDATHRALTERLDLIATEITDNHGQVVHYAGDAVLARFEAVVDALTCAAAIQRRLADQNRQQSPEQKLEFRIGVNLGDVIEDRDDIYGDGVNVAARLESLAEPGGICISESVFTAAGNKLPLRYESMGEQRVKNIANPIHVYRALLLDEGENGGGPSPDAASDRLELPDMPSIAVLPFENMSNDEEQQFFADGITEDIITGLSKIEEMFVIARNSVFTYKGKATVIQDVARDLGVRYVVEGSVRRAGDRLRITGQLIDADDGHHLWAERYDRQLADIFDLQDEITEEIVTALQVKLTEGEQARIRRRQTNNLKAWECFARAQTLLRRFNIQDNLTTRSLLEEAIALDPNFAAAWSWLAWTYLNDVKFGASDAVDASLEQAAALCDKSLSIDDGQPDAHTFLGAVRLHQRRYEEAETEARRGVELGPNVADAFGFLAMLLIYTGRPEEALGTVEKAMRFSPFFPEWYLGMKALCCRMLGRLDEAIALDRERLARSPDNTFSNFRLAVVYEAQGRHDEAREQIAALLRKNPEASVRRLRACEPYQDEDEQARFLDALRAAGLPE